VTIDVYRVMPGGRRRLVTAKHIAANSASFTTRIKRPGPGRYVAIARTPASARYAAAASPAVPFAI
jgi:hypothetical protein